MKMARKYKHFVIGFLVGALLFTFIPANASVQEYILQKSLAKITVDGKEFANKDLPVLNYKGYNYIPASVFRGICEKLGLGFDWVGETNEIQIKTSKGVTSLSSIEMGECSVKNMEKDGYRILTVDGVEYISLREIMNKNAGYEFRYKKNPQTAYFAYNPDNSSSMENQIILVDNIPVKPIQGLSRIEYKFFKENILPLIE